MFRDYRLFLFDILLSIKKIDLKIKSKIKSTLEETLLRVIDLIFHKNFNKSSHKNTKAKKSFPLLLFKLVEKLNPTSK